MKQFWLTLALFVMSTLGAYADNWPQWRGLNNDGISKEKKLPAEWSPMQNVLWKLPLPGMGSSTPCIWGDKIFLTSEDNGDMVAICLSTAGKEVWKKKLGVSNTKARGDEGNGASASPSTDGKHVWFFVGSGELACLDFEGKEVWKFNTQERYGKFDIQFGMHSTPVLHDGKLYLQLLHTKGQWVVCVDAATGKDEWKIQRKSDGRAECEHSYASAMLWTNGNASYLVTHGNDYAIAHSLKDGSEIWRLGGINPKDKYNPTLRLVASPLCTPDLIVIPSAKGGPVIAVKPTAKGTVTGSEFEQWRMPKGTPDVPTPLIYDGLVYLASEQGNLTCLDALTGKPVYESKRLHAARHRASPVYADGKIYVTARDGVINVVKAGKDFELLATNKMLEDMTSSPAIADGKIYLRTHKNFYAIGLK